MIDIRAAVRTPLLHGLFACFVVCGTAAGQSLGTLTLADAVHAKYGLLGRGQTVAIIDSGIAYDHIALGGGLGANFRVVGGKDLTSDNNANPYDDASPLNGHGTRVASVVGADGGGQAGAAPDVDMVGLRVFGDTGASYFSWIESALQWVHTNRNAFESPITTVNLSIGSAWNANTVPAWSTIEDELAQLETDGIFISASAGNSFTTYNQPGLSYPASSPHVVPAMSVDDDGQLSYFSQRHPRALAAPGRLIETAVPDYVGDHNGIADDFALSSGTDMAAPSLAGASVLVREAFEFTGTTTVTEQMIYNQMMNTADTIYDPATSQNYKRLNLEAAVDALMPADDFGSTTATATDLGTVQGTVARNGLVGTVADLDYFAFTAGSTGTAQLHTTASHYLAPHWTVQNALGIPITSQSAADASFSVVAGQRYYVALGTDDGIGYFQASLTIGTALAGDYNNDGRVDAADYSLWRNTLGSNSDLRADGNGNGMVDSADYTFWKQRFGQTLAASGTSLGPGVPEPSASCLIAIAILTAPWRKTR